MSDPQIFDCVQGEPAWFLAREGCVTASRFKDILAKGQGITRRKYLFRLAGERLGWESPETFKNDHTERGHKLEDDARQQYAFQRDVEPERIGFMRRGDVGCSPDSLIGVDGLLEIKTRLPELHMELLESPRLPPEHVAQIQGQLWVSGRQWVDFVSFWPRAPLFCIRVLRDDAYIAALTVEVEAFNAELSTIVRKYQREAT